MNKTILFVVSFFAMNAAWAQQASTAAVSNSMETADKGGTIKPAPLKKNDTPKTIKLGGDEINVEEVRAKYYTGVELRSETHREMFEGRDVEREISKKVYGQPNADYFVKVENHLVKCEDCEDYDEVKAKLELYSADGAVLLSKDFKNERIIRMNVIKNGVFLVDLEPYETQVYKKQEIYNANGDLLCESQNIVNYSPSPQADYILFIEKAGEGIKVGKVDLNGDVRILAELREDLYDIYISDDGTSFMFAGERKSEKIAPSGRKYWQKKLIFFKNSKLVWNTVLEAEAFFAAFLSKSAKYMVVDYHTDYVCENMVSENGEVFTPCKKWVEKFMVVNTATQKTIYDGLKDEKLISAYKDETIKN